MLRHSDSQIWLLSLNMLDTKGTQDSPHFALSAYGKGTMLPNVVSPETEFPL